MSNGKNQHRTERLNVINMWAKLGIQERRDLFKVEKQFRELLNECNASFKPAALSLDYDLHFQREVSYMIDAFDALPLRPDIAFDSIWRAFELEIKSHRASPSNVNITESLSHYAPKVDSDFIALLAATIPTQACEHLFKTIVTNKLRGTFSRAESRIQDLIKSNKNAEFFINHLRTRYVNDTDIERRKGAILIRRAMRGESLKLGALRLFTLDETSRSQILISLYLWTVRNDRYHGDSFSPFISSKTHINTYAGIFYSFMLTYYLLLWLWVSERPQVIPGGRSAIIDSINENINFIKALFGSHWNK